MKNLILIVFISLLYSGCASNVSLQEDMLPNGHWAIWIYSEGTCNELFKNEEKRKLSDEEKKTGVKKTFFENLKMAIATPPDQSHKKCIDLFKDSLTERSKELCQNDNFKIYGCLNSEEASKSGFHLTTIEDSRKLKCYIDCAK